MHTHTQSLTQRGMLVPWQHRFISETTSLWHYKMKCIRNSPEELTANWGTWVADGVSHGVSPCRHSHRCVWFGLFDMRPRPSALTTKHLTGSSSPSSDMLSLRTKVLLFFWCCSFSGSSSLTQTSTPPSFLHISGVVFLVCSWKGPQRRDNRAPARIMSPQREMQLGPRVIQESWWWPLFKVVRDDP